MAISRIVREGQSISTLPGSYFTFNLQFKPSSSERKSESVIQWYTLQKNIFLLHPSSFDIHSFLLQSSLNPSPWRTSWWDLHRASSRPSFPLIHSVVPLLTMQLLVHLGLLVMLLPSWPMPTLHPLLLNIRLSWLSFLHHVNSQILPPFT